MTLTVTGTGLGAQITGVDPNDLSTITREEIREIVYANKLVILKGVHPSPEQYLQLGRIVGDIVPYYESMYHHHEFPEIFVSSTEEHQGVPEPARSGISTTCSCPSRSRSRWCYPDRSRT